MKDEINHLRVLMEETELLFERGRQAAADGPRDWSEEDAKALSELSAKISGGYFDLARKTLNSLIRAKERHIKMAVATEHLVRIDDLQVFFRGLMQIIDEYVPEEHRETVANRILALPTPGPPMSALPRQS